MHKLIDENDQEHFYHSVNKITSVVDLIQGFQYIFVQEECNIAIWQVVNDVNNHGTAIYTTKECIIELTDYYKKTLDRNFDSMQKKLLYL